MEANVSIVDYVDFDDPTNKTTNSHDITKWGIISEDSALDEVGKGSEFISGLDINLQNAALPMEISVQDGNLVVTEASSSDNGNNDGYKSVVNNKHKFKRSSTVTCGEFSQQG